MALYTPAKYTVILAGTFALFSLAHYAAVTISGIPVPGLLTILQYASFSSFFVALSFVHFSEDIYIPLQVDKTLIPRHIRKRITTFMGVLDIAVAWLNHGYQTYHLHTQKTMADILPGDFALYSFYAILVVVAIAGTLVFLPHIDRKERAEVLSRQVAISGLSIFLVRFIPYSVFLCNALLAILVANLNNRSAYRFLTRERFPPVLQKGRYAKDVLDGLFTRVFQTIARTAEINNMIFGCCVILNIGVVIYLHHFVWWVYILRFFLYAWVPYLLLMLCCRYHIILLSKRLAGQLLPAFKTESRDYASFYKYYTSAEDEFLREKGDRLLFYTYFAHLLPRPATTAAAAVAIQATEEDTDTIQVNTETRVAGGPSKKPFPIKPITLPNPLSTSPGMSKINPAKTKEMAATAQARQHKVRTTKDLVKMVYQADTDHIAEELAIGLSVLIKCDKIISEYLLDAIREKTSLKAEVLDIDQFDPATTSSLLFDQLRKLKNQIGNLNNETVLMIPHLDLLAGGSNSYLGDGGRELTQLLYRNIDSPILAFTDITFEIPEILSSRFSTIKIISGIPKTITLEGVPHSTADLMIADHEKDYFKNFDGEELYRVISGMNPFKIRQAIAYAINEWRPSGLITMEQLKDTIRIFKAKTSSNFAVPKTGFDSIGGYQAVKDELIEAISLIKDNNLNIDDEIRSELIPNGFLFYGPPGTGKTLFAKAVAKELMANIMVVSGPETIDMYVGESERKIREIFAEARRNAPSVLVFDEFDSIASNRSNRSDGGARVGNGMVAQILTEMDGFRPDVPVLVIGTTNRLDIIDPALLRPSRFKPISIDLPDPDALKAIITLYARKFDVPLSAHMIGSIAESTKGFNGDEIQSVFKRISIDRIRQPIAPDAIPRKIGEIVGNIMYMKEKQNLNINRRMG